MSDCFINDDERIDEFEGLKVIQKITGPQFSVDAVLLAKFVSIRKGDIVADLGTGGGIISLILASRTEAERITAVEIQNELTDITHRNISLNKLESKIEVIEADLRLAKEHFPSGQFDVVVSNPPYRLVGSGRLNPNSLKAIARHEIKCTLDDVLKSAFYLLKEHGILAVVYRPDRLVDLIASCRRNNLEPKRIQFVYPSIDREANLILLEAVKNGNKETKVLNPLILESHNIVD
ncbi:MAG: tRNA1Val (adenine37-N6)-methyltransferase [Candidatus Poribacteria bacterium]|nr:tRNA1Val (adenine37-N6)-methyltransferase [Candidatus Poribacteria bacterium]